MMDIGHLGLKMDKGPFITNQGPSTPESFKRVNDMEEANTNGLTLKYTMKVIFSTAICMVEAVNFGKMGPTMMANGITMNGMERVN